MPILKGAATFSRYRVETDKGAAADLKKGLTRALRGKAFQPLDRTGPEERAVGFCELADRERTDFGAAALYEGEYAIFSFRIDEIRIPAAALKDELEQWQKKFEKEHQRKPGRKEKNDAKLELRHKLKSRFPVATRTWDVSWNLSSNHLEIWAGPRKAVDEVQAAVEQAFSVKLIPVVPVVLADELGIDEKLLAPTPALSLPERQLEVIDGQA